MEAKRHSGGKVTKKASITPSVHAVEMLRRTKIKAFSHEQSSVLWESESLSIIMPMAKC